MTEYPSPETWIYPWELQNIPWAICHTSWECCLVYNNKTKTTTEAEWQQG